MNLQDGPVESAVAEGDMKVTVERELVSQAEEDDMEALLGTYVYLFSFADTDLTLYMCLYMFICVSIKVYISNKNMKDNVNQIADISFGMIYN